jgi:hypothetical protein
MQTLINEYGVGGTKVGSGRARAKPATFIFMTGHGNPGDNLGSGRPRDQAQLIVNYCNTHGYYCIDYYSIDTHTMDGTYYDDAGDDSNSAAYTPHGSATGRFYTDWQNATRVMVKIGPAEYPERIVPDITRTARRTPLVDPGAGAGWDGN